MNEGVFTYRIDREDVITRVSKNWVFFARANAWGSDYRPEDVVGKRLWDFIEGDETRQLYDIVLRRVREGQRCGPIPFRCDSPLERRSLELFLAPLPDGQIEFTSTIIRTERRDDPIMLLDSHVDRSEATVRICSMCKKMATSPDRWVEVEEGLSRLRLFDAVEMPRLTHGVCPGCYHGVVDGPADPRAPETPHTEGGEQDELPDAGSQ